ncbi:hypothetical protein T10_6709 [Trichinella papuae]|uniref:Uncharacterized protein n=1 Tax=Trichinella papuae TaxID=268474 RepID=A0A0V1MSH2_9BILA|nr:hypothetical protein T10_6709 [Trichinella papuae]
MLKMLKKMIISDKTRNIQTEFYHYPSPSLRNLKRETPNTSTWDIGCCANYPLLMPTEGNG